jgi:hypothetical protein
MHSNRLRPVEVVLRRRGQRSRRKVVLQRNDYIKESPEACAARLLGKGDGLQMTIEFAYQRYVLHRQAGDDKADHWGKVLSLLRRERNHF